MKSDKEKIDKLITIEKENNLMNHILTSFFNKGEVLAEKKNNEYIVWERNYWVGTFYPIFKINFNSLGEIKEIKTELSLNGKLWRIIFGSLLLSFFLFALIIPTIENYEYFEFTDLIIIGIYGILAFGFIWVLKKIYENETKYLLDDLKTSIGLELEENIEKIESSKNEWTLKRTFSRIVLYPFAIFMICFAIYGIYQGTIKRGIFGIFIALAYLYTDIKIITKKKKKN
ncbi:MAG: hypothetical protein AB8B78_05820 [Polaribacter sp.]